MVEQRVTSTPLQLHELNIVNKSQNNVEEVHRTPTKPKNLPSTPTVVKSPQRTIPAREADDDELIYQLAAKRREIIDLETKLGSLKKEVQVLENQFKVKHGNEDTTSNFKSKLRFNTKNSFFKNIVDKFNEFNVNEDEFDSNVRTKNDDDFYLKEGYDFNDEEIDRNNAAEETGQLRKLNAKDIDLLRR
ncbi:hypothetical protein KAFR_0G01030 [Kazachstania africana CBS 2517]|uniref:Uncharacterized protein n=1 Tax=Kazachstania africana (strain ATCC 22294 / BCRC 22015 / CBS 2517 / CECT 1963 / NBRC 1671 / NRRL Y-8276) TaxID=1071382 RepID=H2AXN6_KAZAF|nr:hypothetical protein KAFR_0G01030 [Kazachstania africana CBS 2517]CCF59136.1 hypothetical protein KAFR_0G01030 [Kazachstania africana CBS 2517]